MPPPLLQSDRYVPLLRGFISDERAIARLMYVPALKLQLRTRLIPFQTSHQPFSAPRIQLRQQLCQRCRWRPLATA
jgi:hypothetical protein